MVKLINRPLLEELSRKAAAAPRRRANHNLHPTLNDAVQRLCIAAEPGTYFRPSRHAMPDTWEVLIAIRGALVLLLFEDDGTVRERFVLAPSGDVIGIEIPPHTWHTLASLEPGSVFLEVKEGPYHPTEEKDFAAWAPPEGHAETGRFESWYRSARKGAIPPRW